MPERERTEPVVIFSRRPWICATCNGAFERGDLLTMEDAGPLCMDCADFGHLEFLPRGDAALTRRAKKASSLSPVVVEWSRSRQRYERQGILAEPDAINQAEQECLADSEIRERRRVRDAERRQHEDQQFVADLAAAVQAQFPGCPSERALRIAQHAGVRGSGRIGRTSSGRALDPDAIRLAVVASVRHEDTRYDDLLMSGVDRSEARRLIAVDVDEVIAAWSDGG
jgi:hypothetical protein